MSWRLAAACSSSRGSSEITPGFFARGRELRVKNPSTETLGHGEKCATSRKYIINARADHLHSDGHSFLGTSRGAYRRPADPEIDQLKF
jgi:hypothetical protein